MRSNIVAQPGHEINAVPTPYRGLAACCPLVGEPTMPQFATPLPQSPRSDVLEWRFPKPHQQYVLTGKSRAAWHTSFVIPQLNLLLDAGLCVNKLRPKHVFLTHGHSDHTLLSPAFVKREDPPDIYCPVEMKRVFDDFILANTMLNLGGLVGVDDGPAPTPNGTGAAASSSKPSPASPSGPSRTDAAQPDDDSGAAPPPWLNTHRTHGLRPGSSVALPRHPSVTATAFACDHTVPCLGYAFSQLSRRLRGEYRGLPAAELQRLRRAGDVELTAPHATPVFAFLGDTTAATLGDGGEAEAWLREGVAVVITECSFLYDEHGAQAAKTKHTLWADLEKVVKRWPGTTFVLMHFSLRYSDEDIRRFFKEMADPPGNIVLWVDGESPGEPT